MERQIGDRHENKQAVGIYGGNGASEGDLLSILVARTLVMTFELMSVPTTEEC